MNYWNGLDEPGQSTIINDTFSLKLLEITQINECIVKRKFSLKIATTEQLLNLDKQSSGPFEHASGADAEENGGHIVEHLHDFGWEDDTAKQDENQNQNVQILLDHMIAHRDIVKMAAYS